MVRTSLLALALVGCNPQNATMTAGEYTAFLNVNTSFTLQKDAIDVDDFSDHWAVDCRTFENQIRQNDVDPEDVDDFIQSQRLDDHLDICDGVDEEGEDIPWPPVHELWMQEGGFEVVKETMEPWRGEAIITSEGDFQVAFHHRMPGGADFRFAIVVDPVFNPTQCVQDPEDPTKTLRESVDGDWIAGWTEDLAWLDNPVNADGDALLDSEGEEIDTLLPPVLEPYKDGTLYYLNARAFQFDPNNTADAWSLPNEWRAGFSSGKWSEEFFHQRSSRFGEPDAYAANETDAVSPPEEDIWYCGQTTGAGEADIDATTAACNNLCLHANDVADETAAELALVGVENYRPLVHCNDWRVESYDGRAPGLDAWVGMHYNYMAISKDSDLTVGGSAKGAFALLFEGDDSNSRVVLQGQFEVDRIKQDRWTTDDIDTIKMIQNNTILCGG